MSFFGRFRGTPDKSKSSKKSWEPPKIPPVLPDDEYQVERIEANNTVFVGQTVYNAIPDDLNQIEITPVSKFDFIQNDNDTSHQDSSSKSSFSFMTQDETDESNSRIRSESNRSLQKSLFSFISETNEIDDDNRQVFSDQEGTSNNMGTKKHSESIGSCESGSAFGFISEDQGLNDCRREVEANSGDIMPEGGYLPFEDGNAQDETDTIACTNGKPIRREEETAEIVNGRLKRETVAECEVSESSNEVCTSANDNAEVGENDDIGDSDIGPNRTDLGIRNETLEDLESIIGKNSEDASYDVHLDDEEKFEVYLETLKSRESSLREELNTLRQNRDDLLSNLKETTFSKDYLNSKLMQLQREQNVAVSKEDFALADKINQQVELKQSELRNLKYQHPLLDHRVSKFVDHCNTVIKSHLDECAELQMEFQGIVSTEKESIEKKIAKTEDDISKAKLKFDKEKSKLDREMSHIRLDKEHLEKSRIQLENEVRDRTHDQQLQRSELMAEKQIIRDEIDELEAKLLELRERESAVTSTIEDVDLKIQEMTVDFRPLEESMCKEGRDIAEKEAEVAKKLKILEEDNTKLIERKEAEEQLERKCMENIDALTLKIASLEALQKEMDLNLVTFQEILDVNLLNFLPSKEHEMLSETIKELSNRLSDAKYQDVDCSTQITRIKKRLDDIEARVEELEKEKQMAVSGRNFKAAKIITEERNKIMEEGQEKQDALKHLEETRTELKSSIEKLTREISNAEEESSLIEMESDKRISSSLNEAMRLLQDYHNSSTFDSWIRPFIGFEIEICQDIIKEIHLKHGWKEPDLFSGDDTIVDQEANSEKKTMNIDTEKEDDDIIKELEAQLQMAVESEDFDAADEINCKIEEYRSKIGSKS